MNTLLQTSFREMLQSLLDSSELHHRVRIEGKRGTLMIWKEIHPHTLRIECAGGRSLTHRLTSQEAETLSQFGFRRSTAARPWTQTFNFDPKSSSSTHTLDETCTLLNTLFEQIYSLSPLKEEENQSTPSSDSSLSVHPQLITTPFPEQNNPRLLKAMERLSKERDHRSRQKLYWAFSKATLLLALKSPPPSSSSSPISEFDLYTTSFSKNYDSALAFSDWESVLRYDFRGLDVYPLLGRDITAFLLQRPIASLLINPRGQTGGELYKNELESIHEVMKDYDVYH